MSTLRQFINPGAVRRLFDLTEDAQEYSAVVEEVSRNVVFRGTNLWILMFAIVICSVGLNVNSTAVIIGAMLISPLMGPIIGVGVGVGIFDTQLIRKGARNLLVAVVISAATEPVAGRVPSGEGPDASGLVAMNLAPPSMSRIAWVIAENE